MALPLNLYSVFSQVPVHGQTESLLSYWCCITSTVTTRASTDKRAYIPGETAYITAIVHGSSGTRYDVIIKLVQVSLVRLEVRSFFYTITTDYRRLY